MRLLVDESLSHRVAAFLTDAGHDAVHVRELDLLGARDEEVLAAAHQERRMVVSADSDFGTLLALSAASAPSVLFLRRPDRRAEQRAAAITDALEVAGDELEQGAIAVVEPDRVRLRRLPVGGE